VTRESLLPYAWMLLASLVFAVMGTLAHALGESCNWQVIAFARAALVLVFTAGLALGHRVKLTWGSGTLWMRSVAGSLSMVCTFYALTHVEQVADVLTLTNVFPLWVALLSWPLLRERPGASVLAAVAVGLVGVVLVQRPHLAEGNFEVLAALAASLFTAVAMLGLHRLRGLDTRAVVVHFSAVATGFAAASYFAFEREPPEHPLATGWVVLMLLGVGVTATVGQLCLTKAFAAGPPAKVSVVALTQIVFAALLDAVVLRHPLDLTKLLGMALVVLPTGWVLLARRRKVVPVPHRAEELDKVADPV
jgi:drug/metabolite transporter (DMT)-like permease